MNKVNRRERTRERSRQAVRSQILAATPLEQRYIICLAGCMFRDDASEYFKLSEARQVAKNIWKDRCTWEDFKHVEVRNGLGRIVYIYPELEYRVNWKKEGF